MTPDVRSILARLASGNPYTSDRLYLVHCRIRSIPVTFCVDMEKDPIQRQNRAGNFYETSDLYLLDKYFQKGGTFVDIGANIGNHSLYFALILGAAKVIPIEPNPLAYRLLLHNVLANRLEDRFDLTKLGVGVSDAHAGGYGMEKRERNLGAASMIAGDGALEVYRADTLLEGVTPDFIKIDVEGMEIAALHGLSGVLDRCRPNLFVEVATENEATFFDWCDDAGYRVEQTRQRYRNAKNFLIVPRE